MKKILITVSSVFVVALIIVNSFVLSASEGNVKSQLLLSNVSSFAYDPADPGQGSGSGTRTPSESSNNNCTFESNVTITVTKGNSYSTTGTVSANVQGEAGVSKLVSVGFSLGATLSSTSGSSSSNTVSYTHKVSFGKSNAFVRLCNDQDDVPCNEYYECNDLIRQAYAFASALAAQQSNY